MAQVVIRAPNAAAIGGEKGAASRQAARKPTCWVTRIVGPGVVSASPSPSAISAALSQPFTLTASCASQASSA